MLEIKNLSYKIKKKQILNDLNISFENGVYGFLGPNGAGKTTLMRCITGIYDLPKNANNIILDGKSYKVGDGKDEMGYLPQNFGMFKDMKVKDMMMYLAMLKGVDEKEAQVNIKECLSSVNLLDRIDDKVKSLSGGMVRRLGIAQALIGNPKVILFDEPTTGLDPEERIRFKNIIKALPKDRIVIISTHIVSDVEDICDKVAIINKGRFVFNGSLDELKAVAKESSKEGTSLLEEGYLCALKEN